MQALQEVFHHSPRGGVDHGPLVVFIVISCRLPARWRLQLRRGACAAAAAGGSGGCEGRPGREGGGELAVSVQCEAGESQSEPPSGTVHGFPGKQRICHGLPSGAGRRGGAGHQGERGGRHGDEERPTEHAQLPARGLCIWARSARIPQREAPRTEPDDPGVLRVRRLERPRHLCERGLWERQAHCQGTVGGRAGDVVGTRR
mmetsp:Transcript_44902/g.128814  ORF Transcript_44902/g.128814 Transcript_44902/m.128814 type:complete len:202 (+) Transcript_44902:250-855(+)